MKDNALEMLPLVDEQGHVTGQATRGECHNGSHLLHPVVHLHVFNPQGQLYLQHRPAWKDVQPNRWDTAVGGHVDLNETPQQALLREAREELGLSKFKAIPLWQYVHTNAIEAEWVSSYYTVLPEGSTITPSEETDGGRFWNWQEIEQKLAEQDIFTPNFTEEFKRMQQIHPSLQLPKK